MQASPKAPPSQPPSQITATLPDHSHPHKARMPPAFTWWCQAPAHPPGADNPTCKEPLHPPPLSPSHPHGQVRLHSRRGRRHAGEEGARAHLPAAPRPRRAGRGRRAEPAGRRRLPPCSARPAAFVPLPPGNPRSTRPAGRPPHGPLQNGSVPRPRELAAASLRASGTKLAKWVPQEPMAAAEAVACAGESRRSDSAGGAGGRRRNPGISPPPARPGPSEVPLWRACALSAPPGKAGLRTRG